MVITSVVVMAATWSIGKRQKGPSWAGDIMGEIHSAAAPPLRPSLAAAAPKVRVVASTEAAERALKHRAGAGGGDPAGATFKTTLLSNMRLPVLCMTCAFSLCVIWCVPGHTVYRSWDVAMDYQVMIPSALLLSLSHDAITWELHCSRLLTVQRSAKGWARLVVY